ncbi:NAD(P)-dependent dehydrogenase (short-subunit alcohol dehydrogenase family) [Leifsonia sp. AK011]|uniref:SDR family oxidoreductase n=1 Tax=Leifsonia sp. AK011 TaxID=2723075 RepID=UPI0015CCE5EC|nr:SDR family oxidoreductase [Leifsonia sp. AK011]NYF11509.1 NAD(P)-dependent dehydrogenase (short-subunit alcohol dehydrogenase family) [Leifsonia sp. AK011]
MTTSHKNELIVISGASTGMGAATARDLAARGYHVLAGVRSEKDANAASAAGIEPVLLDITVPDHISSLAARIDGDPNGRQLRAIVNNAGIAINAPVEALPLEQWRQQFEVNLFGHIAVTQALLPFLRRSHGRIVNISSVGGKISLGTYGAYAGAKFAFEAVSDSLRRELLPQGVQVVVVEPGGVKTEMTGRGIVRARSFVDDLDSRQRELYGPLMQAVMSHAAAFTESGVSAEKAASVIATAATAARPKTRYTIGRDAAMMTRLARVLPDRVLDRITAADLRPHFPTVSTAH